MHYSKIKFHDIADGTGVRTALFVSGCRNHCKGCFQPETWDFGFGCLFDAVAEQQIIDSMAKSYVEGLTLLGGDPFEEENQQVLAGFLERFRKQCPGKNVWAYTGYVLDKDLVPGGRKYTPYTGRMLQCIDILVDGPFIEEKRNLMLRFRGSENQRVIDMGKFRDAGTVSIAIG